MLIENGPVKKVHLMGDSPADAGGAKSGAENLGESRCLSRLVLPASKAWLTNITVRSARMTLTGTRTPAIVEEDSVNLLPNTTLVIPAQATRQAINTGEEDLVILIIRKSGPPLRKSPDAGDIGKPALILLTIMLERRPALPESGPEESRENSPDPRLITYPKNLPHSEPINHFQNNYDELFSGHVSAKPCASISRH